MSDDLIERLEFVAAWHTPAGRTPKMPRPPIHTTCRQAIARIQRLTAQLAEARQAERAAVVAWLKSMVTGHPESGAYGHAAFLIEAGEHLS